MKSFYEFVQLLKENEQAGAMINQPPANQPRTGEERRKHFGIQGTGGGRTDDSVIYNDLHIDYDGHVSGRMIVWFDDDKDLDSIDNDTREVVLGYGDVSGNWSFNYNFTVVFTDNPSKSYPPGPRGGWPIGLPNTNGSGIVKIEIKDLEERPDEGPDYDSDGLNEVSDDYGAGDYYDNPDVSFRTILGEGDEDAPFSVEVDIENGYWDVVGGIWVLGYVPNGSENPASRPVPQTAGEKDRFGHPHKLTGTEFENPGKDLELLPEPIKSRAIDWIEKEVQKAMGNYKPEDPRDHQDKEDPWRPNWGVHGQEPGYYRAD